MALLFLQLPDYIIGSLEDSGVKYVPYVTCYCDFLQLFALFWFSIAHTDRLPLQSRWNHRRGGYLSFDPLPIPRTVPTYKCCSLFDEGLGLDILTADGIRSRILFAFNEGFVQFFSILFYRSWGRKHCAAYIFLGIWLQDMLAGVSNELYEDFRSLVWNHSILMMT